jgi:cytoplasmic iron level regulating protein YaaA (DUF328/UPF0246 family)
MLIILSPTKTIDMSARPVTDRITIPVHLNRSLKLINELKNMSVDELTSLMNISPKLAQLNFERFQQWQLPFTPDNARQALFTFKGEVFNGLDAGSLSEQDVGFAQNHLIILSGLYGTLRPLDLIQPYRLEMGIKASFAGSSNLYEFWKEIITKTLRKALNDQSDNLLINLASNEYFKSIDTKKLNARIITPEFKDFKNGTYKIITIYAKKARGMMIRFILQNRIVDPEKLKLFDSEGYYFNEELSKDDNFVFTRFTKV